MIYLPQVRGQCRQRGKRKCTQPRRKTFEVERCPMVSSRSAPRNTCQSVRCASCAARIATRLSALSVTKSTWRPAACDPKSKIPLAVTAANRRGGKAVGAMRSYKLRALRQSQMPSLFWNNYLLKERKRIKGVQNGRRAYSNTQARSLPKRPCRSLTRSDRRHHEMLPARTTLAAATWPRQKAVRACISRSGCVCGAKDPRPAAHDQRCAQRRVQCKACKAKIFLKDRSEHAQSCPAKVPSHDQST